MSMGKFFRNLTTLPGSGQMNQANAKIKAMAGQFADAYNQYAPNVYQALWQQYENPLTPWDQGQMSAMQAGVLRQTQQAGNQMQQALMNRGLGQSSMMGNNLGALWNAYGQTMSNARLQQMNELEQRRQRALASLGGYVVPAGSTALNAYQNVYQLGAQQQQNFLDGLMGGAKLAGTVFGLPPI